MRRWPRSVLDGEATIPRVAELAPCRPDARHVRRRAVPPRRLGLRGESRRLAHRRPQERLPRLAAESHWPRPRPPLPRNFHGYPSATGTYPDPRRRDRAVRRAARVSVPSPARGDGQSKGSEQDVAEEADVTR